MFDINKLKQISKNSMTAIKEANNKTASGDDRFWKVERDTSGNGMAIIRFLPSLDENALPWAEEYRYFIRNGNARYFEKSLRSYGLPDPMDEYRRDQYLMCNTEEQKREVSAKFRQDHKYICNVLVIKDPAHPENEGKVKLFRFGKKIYDKIIDKANDDFGDKPVNVFDWFNGANFKIRVTTVSDFPNYDRSEFDTCSPVGDDQKILSIANAMYDLKEFTDPSKTKSYEELKEIRDRVFGLGKYAETSAPVMTQARPETTNKFGVASQPAPTAVAPTQTSASWETEDIDFDEMMKEVNGM